jgi:hypothetical protein
MHLHEIVKIDASAFSAVHCSTTLGISAADLKFLHRLPQALKDFKSNRGTGVTEFILELVVPFCFPKFMSEGAAMYYEFRKQGTRP